MAELVLAAESGRTLGSRETRRLRHTGRVPGVVYGLDQDPVPLSVDFKELRAALTTSAGLNALISLEVAGTKQLSLVKELQRHPVRNDVIHVDFLRVDPNKPIQVTVPVALVGEPEKVNQFDGMVEQPLLSVVVYAKPTEIPTEIACDISDLEIGTSVRAESLQFPPGVTSDIDPNDVVAVGSETRASKMAMAAARGEVFIDEDFDGIDDNLQGGGTADSAEADSDS
jgi:large subunit ribosomal protein L25